MTQDLLAITINTLQKFCPDLSFPITAEMKIVEDLGLESIDFVDFIFELEKAANLRIDIVHLSVALSKGSRRFRAIKISDIAQYLQTLRG